MRAAVAVATAKNSNGTKRKRFEDVSNGLSPDLCLLHMPESEEPIFLPRSTAEISRLIGHAHINNLDVSILNNKDTATHGSSRGGDMIIHLRHNAFREIKFDSSQMVAHIGGGADSRMVDTVLTSQNVFTPMVGYTVGAGAMVSGGFGFASRLHGLGSDNIIGAEVVLASGEVLQISDQAHPDLFWAVKGCGTSFVCITKLSVRCFPLLSSLTANIIYPFSSSTTSNLIKHWRDCVRDAPKEIYSNIVLAAGPQAPSGAVVIIQVCCLGAKATGLPLINKIAAFPDEKYHMKDIDEITYLRQQELVEAVLKGAAVTTNQRPDDLVRYELDGCTIPELTDSMVEESCDLFGRGARASSIWCYELFGRNSSVADVKSSCIPDYIREAQFHAASIMRVPIEEEETISSEKNAPGRKWIREIVNPTGQQGPLPSFLASFNPDSPQIKHYHNMIRMSYGHENWMRLKKIKKMYDPANMFCYGVDMGMLGFEENLIDGI